MASVARPGRRSVRRMSLPSRAAAFALAQLLLGFAPFAILLLELGVEARVLESDGGLRAEDLEQRDALWRKRVRGHGVLEIDDPGEPFLLHQRNAEERSRTAAKLTEVSRMVGREPCVVEEERPAH